MPTTWRRRELADDGRQPQGVRGELPRDLFFGGRLERSVQRVPSVVDEHIDASVSSESTSDGVVDGGRAGHVEMQQFRPVPAMERSGTLLGTAHRRNDVPASVKKKKRRLQRCATGRACDEHGLFGLIHLFPHGGWAYPPHNGAGCHVWLPQRRQQHPLRSG
jgi:hypothetical protein